MKKTNTIIALLIPFAIAALSCLPGCYRRPCDPVPYNGMDYQMFLGQDSMYLYDGERLVVGLPWSETGKLDSIIIADNE